MADEHPPPKASDLLSNYHQALKSGGLSVAVADDIVRDAAAKLHSGDLALLTEPPIGKPVIA